MQKAPNQMNIEYSSEEDEHAPSDYVSPVPESPNTDITAIQDTPNQLNESSFSIPNIPIAAVNPIVEDSLEEDERVPSDYVCPVPDSVTTYSKIEDGTKRGKPKLIDSLGYSYVVKRRLVNTIYI